MASPEAFQPGVIARRYRSLPRAFPDHAPLVSTCGRRSESSGSAYQLWLLTGDRRKRENPDPLRCAMRCLPSWTRPADAGSHRRLDAALSPFGGGRGRGTRRRAAGCQASTIATGRPAHRSSGRGEGDDDCRSPRFANAQQRARLSDLAGGGPSRPARRPDRGGPGFRTVPREGGPRTNGCRPASWAAAARAYASPTTRHR